MMRPAATFLCATLALGCLAATAAAQFTSTPRASAQVATLEVAALASAQATTVDACATVLIEWPAASGADSFDVEVERDGSAWQALATDVGAVNSATDTAAQPGSSVRYRVTPRHRTSGWTGAPALTTPLAC